MEAMIAKEEGARDQSIHTPLTPACKADFVTKCKVIRERLSSRQSEVLGRWMTEERMRKSGEFSASAIRAIISYCQKFPESMCRIGAVQRSLHSCFWFGHIRCCIWNIAGPGGTMRQSWNILWYMTSGLP